jgi:hypothetical protein
MNQQDTRNTGSDMNNTNHAVNGSFGARCAQIATRACFGLALCALLVPLARAQASDAVPNSEIGHSAHDWLELQRSNAQAAPALPMLGAEAGYAWRRYLKSFDTAIPASFGSSIDTGQNQTNLLNTPTGSSGTN